MNKKLTLLALGALLCGSQAFALDHAAQFMPRRQPGLFGVATLGLGTLAAIPAFYYGLPFKAIYKLWYATKSTETIVGEATNFVKYINERYAQAFALAQEANTVTKLDAAKKAASTLQAQYRKLNASAFERFHSKVTAVYDKLNESPMVFALNAATYDLSWAQWYLDRVGAGQIQTDLTQVTEKLQAFADYIRTTDTFLQESSLIKQEANTHAQNIPQIFGKPLRLVASMAAAALCGGFTGYMIYG